MTDETKRPQAQEAEEPACHDLKTWLDPFDALLSGAKTFEIRKDDRGFEVGDCLHLREWNEGAGIYTGRWINALVTYKVPGGLWGLPDHLCVLAIRETARWPQPAAAFSEAPTVEQERHEFKECRPGGRGECGVLLGMGRCHALTANGRCGLSASDPIHLQLAAAPGSGERECDEHCYDAGDSGFRAGLETAARYMESRKVTASEFYAREIRALSPPGSGEGRELREAAEAWDLAHGRQCPTCDEGFELGTCLCAEIQDATKEADTALRRALRQGDAEGRK